MKRLSKSRSLVTTAVAAVLAFGSVAFPLASNAMADANTADQNSAHVYVAFIQPLNGSHATGTAKFIQQGRRLSAVINAQGLEPGIHPQHIHGKEAANAECPTLAQDTNHDGFISVVEGAPSYGPIKMNLTSPQTAFGTPPTPALFAPFAGTPDNKNFPTAGADGNLNFTQTYTFDDSTAAQAAFTSLTPLGSQEYVLHGATAPQGVDADAFAALGSPRPSGYDPATRSYDVLLPAGCGELEEATTAGSPTVIDTTAITTAANERVAREIAAAQLKVRDALDAAALRVNSATVNQTNQQNNVLNFANQASQLTANLNTQIAAAFSQFNTNIASGMDANQAHQQLMNALNTARDQQIASLNAAHNQLMVQQQAQQGVGVMTTSDSSLDVFNSTMLQINSMVSQTNTQQ